MELTKNQNELITDIEEFMEDFGVLDTKSIHKLQSSLYITHDIYEAKIRVENGEVIIGELS